MDKEDILLKNYSILSKNPINNADALEALILQLSEVTPELAIRCWSDLLNNNIKLLESDFYKEEFPYDSFGYRMVNSFELHIIGKESFKHALHYFAKDKNLLEILYSKSPISNYTHINYAIAYLIRNNRLSEADAILAAIYKNKTYKGYSNLWKKIIDRFPFIDLDNYCGGGAYDESNYKQSTEIQEFCLSWGERIKDDEQQAGAMTHIMRIL